MNAGLFSDLQAIAARMFANIFSDLPALIARLYAGKLSDVWAMTAKMFANKKIFLAKIFADHSKDTWWPLWNLEVIMAWMQAGRFSYIQIIPTRTFADKFVEPQSIIPWCVLTDCQAIPARVYANMVADSKAISGCMPMCLQIYKWS